MVKRVSVRNGSTKDRKACERAVENSSAIVLPTRVENSVEVKRPSAIRFCEEFLPAEFDRSEPIVLDTRNSWLPFSFVDQILMSISEAVGLGSKVSVLVYCLNDAAAEVWKHASDEGVMFTKPNIEVRVIVVERSDR